MFININKSIIMKNIIRLTREKILLKINGYINYTDIIFKHIDILLSKTWRRNIMYLEFNYNDESVNRIKDIFDNLEKKYQISLQINNSKLVDIIIIQQIVNLDYFTDICFEKEFNSKYIDFRNLKNCKEIVYKSNFYQNSFLLPENLDKITLVFNSTNSKFKKNIIFGIPNGLKKICIKMSGSGLIKCLFDNTSNTNIKKLFIINTTISNKNQLEIFHDYDFLIVYKFIESNVKYIDLNNLPYTLKILHIHDKINQDILALPDSLEELKINYYDKNLLENLPCTLKKINLDFSIGMENIKLLSFLPNSLEEITINNFSIPNHAKIFDLKLPSNLKVLNIIASTQNFEFVLTKCCIDNNIKVGKSKFGSHEYSTKYIL
jgi:hypothetical protein